jgi:hypothetical protein
MSQELFTQSFPQGVKPYSSYFQSKTHLFKSKPMKSIQLVTTLCVLFISIHSGKSAPENQDLLTLAEKTGWKKTGRYQEAVELAEKFERAFPGKVKVTRFGQSPEGRPMIALIASGDGLFDPAKVRESKRPVMFFQGGIHPGEIDGKDAGFQFLREILEGKILPGSLSKLTFVFVPVFSVDGHERFFNHNRPNQNGPEEMGWRVTSQNLNLNRDYVKADAPEMRAMLNLLNSWDPIIYLDLHVTDGADFQHEIAVMIEPSLEGPQSLRSWGVKILDEMMQRLKKDYHPLLFYPSFIKEDVPTSGAKRTVALPRFSQAYWAQHNRLGVLIETHSWKPYPLRVKITHDVLLNCAEIAMRDGHQWMKAAATADQEMSTIGGKSINLTYDYSKKSRMIDFLGYKYTRELSPITGQLETTYFPDQKEVWKIPLFDEPVAKLTVKAPKGGYIVPAGHAHWIAEHLKNHGIRYKVIGATQPKEKLGVFRFSKTTLKPTTFEGRTMVEVEGAWAPEEREILRGSLFVPIRQPLSRLVTHIFEPKGPDSYLSWGFFNAHLEVKEIMEPYVAVKVAEEMMARDPKVKEEFYKRIETDPEFAKDRKKRLEFFYRLHPSWDERFNLYPVYQTDKEL